MPGYEKTTLEKAGSRLEDVVRTFSKLTNIGVWKKADQVRALYFSDRWPVEIVIQVSGFIGPDGLIEIVVDAV